MKNQHNVFGSKNSDLSKPITTTLRLTPELWEQTKIEVARRRLTVNEFINQLIVRELAVPLSKIPAVHP